MHVDTHEHNTHKYLLLILVSRADISEFQKFLTAAQIATAPYTDDLVAVLLFLRSYSS